MSPTLAPTKTVPITIIRNGQPISVEIDYALYLQLQEAIDRWYGERQAKRQASESYQTMLASEAILRQEWDNPEDNAAWSELELQLIAEAEQIDAATEKDPSTLISHAELKRLLAKKKAHVAA